MTGRGREKVPSICFIDTGISVVPKGSDKYLGDLIWNWAIVINIYFYNSFTSVSKRIRLEYKCKLWSHSELCAWSLLCLFPSCIKFLINQPWSGLRDSTSLVKYRPFVSFCRVCSLRLVRIAKTTGIVYPSMVLAFVIYITRASVMVQVLRLKTVCTLKGLLPRLQGHFRH